MKKIALLLAFALLAFGSEARTDGAGNKQPGSSTSIAIGKGKLPRPPRSAVDPADIIQGLISPDCNRLALVFPQDLGPVYVDITGDNGLTTSDMIDSSSLHAEIDTTELPVGAYTITITTEEGEVYTGYFEFI
jgi:hypothetical protein